MGLIQSCLGKKNKVGVMSEDESEAYRKIEKEVRKEEEEDIIHTKPLPWLMFAAKPGPSRSDTDEVNSSTVTEVVEKKGGVTFSIDYKSSVPKLPSINLNRAGVHQGEDYENWKEEKDKLLVDKHEQAKIRREKFILQRIKSARRPRTARSRASTDDVGSPAD
ncbi:uncharacterized protein LOC144622732 [Crassostrea virginica]